jgi:hypothetical protein
LGHLLFNPGHLRAAIGEYKNAFIDILDVAEKLHRAFNGLPPLFLEYQVSVDLEQEIECGAKKYDK